ncbi:MAG: hypothetical protein K9W42_12685 [Candidatus Heimdallarchaeota archaeon]|nr:hypothetical protein [Candidatus Heimdallarchaeota archaeon]
MSQNESKIMGHQERKSVQKLLRILIFFMPPIIILTIVLCWWQYPEPYEFFQEYISALGGIKSELGFDNHVSMTIFITGFITMAFLTLSIAIIYLIKKDLLKYATRKSIYAFFLSFGALFVAFPHDFQHVVHGIGAFLFVFGFAFFNFAAQALRFFRKRSLQLHKYRIGVFWDIFLAIFVFVVMLLFLVFYFFQFAHGLDAYHLPQIGQKIVLIVDCVAIYFIDINDM